MTTKAPTIEQWSKEISDSDAIGNKLIADEIATNTEAHRLMSLNGTGENREARAAMYATGKAPQPTLSIKTQLDNAIMRLADIKLAREIHADKHRDLRASEGKRLCKDVLKSTYEANAKKFAEHLVGINEFLVMEDQLRASLMRQGLGFYPIVLNLDTEDVFGSPGDPGSDIVRLLRQCVQFGYLNKLPAGLR